MLVPRNRVIGADDDLGCADLCDEVAQRLRRKDERIKKYLLHVLGRFLLEFDVRITAARVDEAAVVHARRVRTQEAATVHKYGVFGEYW